MLDSTATRHNMDALALKYLAYQTIHFEDIAGKGVRQLRFDQIPVAKAAPYAAEDADITLRLHQTLWPKLQQQEGLQKLYTDVELPLLSVLSRVERNGVLIDAHLLQQQSQELALQLKQIEEDAFELAGEAFNMSSPKQIQAILFDKMQEGRASFWERPGLKVPRATRLLHRSLGGASDRQADTGKCANAPSGDARRFRPLSEHKRTDFSRREVWAAVTGRSTP